MISGVSSTLVTFTVTAQLSDAALAVVRLHVDQDIRCLVPKGFSKSGRMLKLRTPDALPILKCVACGTMLRPQVMVSAGFRSSSVYV